MGRRTLFNELGRRPKNGEGPAWRTKDADEAEEKACKLLKSFNAGPNNKKKIMAVDLRAKFKNKDFFIEVERDQSKASLKWKSPKTWPYDLINIPIEKERHFIKKPKCCFYFKFSKDLKNCLILHGKDIIKHGKKQLLRARYPGGTTAMKEVIRVPKEHAKFLKSSNKKSIKKFITDKLT